MAQQKDNSVKSKNSSSDKTHSPYILLVEDEPTHEVIMRHTIKGAFPNVSLKVAASLKEYRKTIENSVPDLVLMDLHLPDGKALEILTSPIEAGQFPIIVMTSSGDEKTAVKAMKAGALDYIVKSTEAYKSLPHTIERALNEWKLIQDRKQAEEDLRESEIKYRTLYENLTIGLYRTTPAGKILLANQALVKMLGYDSFEQLTERNLSKTGFGRTTLRKEFLKIIETEGEVIDYESTWTRQDGSLIIVRENARAIRDSGGKTIYYDGTVEDITEHRLSELAGKYAEDALRESEQKYRSLFDNAVEGIYHSTPEGRLISVNNACAKILGYESPEEIITSVTDINQQLYANPDERKKAVKMIKEKGFLKDYEVQLRKKDGSIIWAILNARLVRTTEGRIYFEGSVTDVTERKLAKDALEESEKKYRSIVEQSVVGIGISKGPKILFANEALLRMFNYENFEDFSKNSLLDIIAPSSISIVKDRIKKVAEGKHLPSDYECDILCKGGLIKTVRAFSAHIKTGKEIFTQTIFQDITERNQVEKVLEKERQDLKLLMDTAPLIIFYKDLKGKLLRANQALLHTLNKKEEDILGKTAFDLYSKEIAQSMTKDDIEVIESNRPKLNIIEKYESDSGLRWLQTIKIPIQDKTKKPIGLIGISLDITEKINSEQALRESEEKFRKAFMTTPDAININRQEDGQYISINESFTRLTGYTEQDIIGKTSIEKNIWVDIEDREKLIEGLKKDGIVENLEARFRTKSGEKKHGIMSASVIELNGVKHILSITRDITDRKAAETALRERDIQFKKLASQVPGMIYQFLQKPDGSYCVPFSSEGIKEIFGCSPADVKDDFAPIAKAIFPEDLPNVISSIQESARHLTDWHCEYRVQLPGQPLRWMLGQSTPEKLRDGSIIWHGFNTEITERKRSDEALRHSEAQLTAFMNFVPALILIKDNEFRPIFANEKFSVYFPIEEWMGKKPDEIFQQDIADLMIIKDMEAMEKGYTNYEEKWIDKKGEEHIFYTQKFKITIPGGKPLLGAIISDITERKRAEEAVRQMQKLEGLGTLAGGIAHDFNNILGIILAYNTNIKRFKDDAKSLEIVTETIKKAVERGKTLVQQILTFARKTETTFGPVNVNDVVIEVMTMILETFPKILTYSQNFDKEIPRINADHSQIYQAVLNLCLNARDAMPNGGLLTISTCLVTGASIYSRHPEVSESHYVCIEVNDTGEGMTEDVKKRIFEPFFTTKDIGKGTGLGLAVVFGVVQTHKGFIDVDSEIGKGTTISMYLPVSKLPEQVVQKEEEKPEEIRGGTETLLVVEDEEMLIMSLQMILIENGYNVLPARDGLEALKVYQENKDRISLILTDLGLPTITGLEVCQRIKSIKPEIRVILATGYLDPEMKAEFSKTGIEHFLFKPYDLNKVLKVVREVLDAE